MTQPRSSLESCLGRRAALGAVATGGLLFLAPRLARAAEPPPIETVIRVMDELYRSSSSVSRMEVTIEKGDKVRSMVMKAWTKGLDKALVVIEEPARDKGTATLKVDQNLWNYLPKIGRTVRIPPSMMLSSWMGSDFTNDDLVREASYQQDFDAAWGARSASPSGWTLVLTAKPGLVGLWKRLEMVLDDTGRLPLLARYYDRKDRLGRTMYFEEVRSHGGRQIPSVMRLVPADKPEQSTRMRYLELQFDADVPDATFSLSRLERGR
jgi:outer membrane lipoprotein-sorting protein